MGKNQHYFTIATSILGTMIGIVWLLIRMDNSADLSYDDGIEPALLCLASLSALAISIFTIVALKTNKKKPKHDVFLSIPMSAVKDESAYQENRTLAREVWEAIQQHTSHGTRYCAVIDHATKSEMDDAQAANDLAELNASGMFVLIYPRKLASSCLVEVGMAIALDIRCILFVHDKDDLPYVLQEIGQQEQNVFIYTYKGISDLTDIVVSQKDVAFNLAA